MRFEFVNDVKEINMYELCVDYGKLRNLPGEKIWRPAFCPNFSRKCIFLQAITFAKSTK
jgi:hypothetical protein